MEYLIAKFPDDRDVAVDGVTNGKTNLILEVEKGTHIITLESPPHNFSPAKIKIILKDTTEIKPREVHFAKV
jgi:hypothetical protein